MRVVCEEFHIYLLTQISLSQTSGFLLTLLDSSSGSIASQVRSVLQCEASLKHMVNLNHFKSLRELS